MISKPSKEFIKKLDERIENGYGAISPRGALLIQWMELNGYVVVSKKKYEKKQKLAIRAMQDDFYSRERGR